MDWKPEAKPIHFTLKIIMIQLYKNFEKKWLESSLKVK
jgi:hypothetical protein